MRPSCCHADGGGSNASRSRLWRVHCAIRQSKAESERLSLPAGTSSGTRLEHRPLFTHQQNWRGRPLVSREAVVALICSTTTRTDSAWGRNSTSQVRRGKDVSTDSLKSVRSSLTHFTVSGYAIRPKPERTDIWTGALGLARARTRQTSLFTKGRTNDCCAPPEVAHLTRDCAEDLIDRCRVSIERPRAASNNRWSGHSYKDVCRVPPRASPRRRSILRSVWLGRIGVVPLTVKCVRLDSHALEGIGRHVCRRRTCGCRVSPARASPVLVVVEQIRATTASRLTRGRPRQFCVNV